MIKCDLHKLIKCQKLTLTDASLTSSITLNKSIKFANLSSHSTTPDCTIIMGNGEWLGESFEKKASSPTITLLGHIKGGCVTRLLRPICLEARSLMLIT